MQAKCRCEVFMKRNAVFTVILLFSVFASQANPFNSKLSGEELSKLNNGEVLIRNIGSMKEISVERTEKTEKIISTMKALNPKYVAEIIQVRPYKGNEDLQEKIDSTLQNIRDYVGIPYYSERAEGWYDLYSSAQIKRTTYKGSKKIIDCVLDMTPFGEFAAQIITEKEGDNYFYSMRNIDRLDYYEKFTAVKPEKMISCISVFRDGDNWILYAIGGVNTYKIFFLQERVETSFMNRIKTFCNFIFSKI